MKTDIKFKTEVQLEDYNQVVRLRNRLKRAKGMLCEGVHVKTLEAKRDKKKDHFHVELTLKVF